MIEQSAAVSAAITSSEPIPSVLPVPGPLLKGESMKKRFVLTVEYPDDFGPTWLKKDKVLQFLQEYFKECYHTRAAVFNVTVEDMVENTITRQ